MRGAYIGKGLMVPTTQLSMWDKRSEKQRVGGKKSHVRTAKSRVRTLKFTRAEGWWPEEEPGVSAGTTIVKVGRAAQPAG